MSERLTDEELDAIEARANAATEGPWMVDTCCVICRCEESETAHKHVDGGHYGVICDTGEYDDCRSLDFIAQAREDVPRLIAEVRRLRAELEGKP